MKATAWSLAFVAGASAAWTHGPDGALTECPDEYTTDPAPMSSMPVYSAPAYSAPATTDPVESSIPAYPSEPASSVPAWPSEPAAPVSSASPTTYTDPSVVTNTHTVYTTVCPCTDPAPTGGVSYVTNTHYYNPTEKPYTWGEWTSVYTSYETSYEIVTYTGTVTAEPVGPTDPATYPAGSAPAGSWPAGYPSASSPGWYGTGTAAGTGAVETCSKPKPTGSCTRCEGNPGDDQYCGYTINDNYYEVVPNTCEEKVYHWTLSEATVSPDGYSRPAMLIEGSMPGPLIEANWGDTITVHLYNNLPADGRNGTSLHFHGIHQNYTNEYDGVSSITQCPLAPGHSMTYTFRATSYGSSWWHAHYTLQTYEGMFGPMIIHGPGDTGYDDEQSIMLQDWTHDTADELYYRSLYVVPGVQGGPVTVDTGLINGMNVGSSGGQYFSMTVESGKTYRLRVVNVAIQSTFKFHIDGHSFKVIAMDFVPIVPYETNLLTINIGQRYDLLVTADQPVDNYWMNSDNQAMCGPMVDGYIKGIFHYDGAPTANPTTTPIGYQPNCLDEPYENLVPVFEWDAGAADQTVSEAGPPNDAVIAPNGGNPNVYKWTLSGTTFQVQWGEPTLFSIYENGTIPADYQGNLAINVPNLGEWVYVIIDSPMPLPHPIHLHGHDFMLLAQGTGLYNAGVSLNLKNPPRRDVVVMPADPPNGLGGYIVIAYYTSNPGVWLLHCHIGWHNAMGFALQIIENLEGIKETVDNECQMKDLCKSWDAYASQYDVFTQNLDSGV